MTGLAHRLREFIASHGPIGLDQYMSIALSAANEGYYQQRDPIGAAGDFTTAPEIGQIFGEMIGIAFAQTFLDLGSPTRLTLVELGPGRGTLMRDLARAIRHIDGMTDALDIVLVETSPALRAVQARTLAGLRPRWCDTIEAITGDGPLFVIANEFLDALPVRQFVRAGLGWRERVVALGEDGSFVFTASPRPLPATAALPARAAGLRDGAIIELSPARENAVRTLARSLVQRGGIALLVDYGSLDLSGDSLQAVRQHALADPLDRPGEVDLSSHVDFSAVASAAKAEGCSVHGAVPQGVWLQRMGAALRLEQLLTRATEAQRRELESGFRRLMAPDEMGILFKVMALTPGTAPVPSGFEQEERL